MIVYSHTRRPDLFREVAKLGMHVNQSADTLDEADQLSANGLPVVVVLHPSYGRGERETLRDYRDRIGGMSFETPAGYRVAICPATYLDTDCNRCRVCATPRQGGTIIGFPAHGTKKGSVSKRVEQKRWFMDCAKHKTAPTSVHNPALRAAPTLACRTHPRPDGPRVMTPAAHCPDVPRRANALSA